MGIATETRKTPQSILKKAVFNNLGRQKGSLCKLQVLGVLWWEGRREAKPTTFAVGVKRSVWLEYWEETAWNFPMI